MFNQVPKYPGNSPPNATKKQRIAYRGKLLLRQEAMSCLGWLWYRDKKSEA